jgi:DnaJ-class molecular chaperone
MAAVKEGTPPCSSCKGSGQVPVFNGTATVLETCPKCKGEGR